MGIFNAFFFFFDVYCENSSLFSTIFTHFREKHQKSRQEFVGIFWHFPIDKYWYF